MKKKKKKKKKIGVTFQSPYVFIYPMGLSISKQSKAGLIFVFLLDELPNQA